MEPPTSAATTAGLRRPQPPVQITCHHRHLGDLRVRGAVAGAGGTRRLRWRRRQEHVADRNLVQLQQRCTLRRHLRRDRRLLALGANSTRRSGRTRPTPGTRKPRSASTMLPPTSAAPGTPPRMSRTGWSVPTGRSGSPAGPTPTGSADRCSYTRSSPTTSSSLTRTTRRSSRRRRPPRLHMSRRCRAPSTTTR
jgi:hypothetical protein